MYMDTLSWLNAETLSFKPYSALFVTLYCALCRKDSLHAGAQVLAERVGQVEVGGITCTVLCAWQLLGLAVKGPWLAPVGSGYMNGLRECYSHLVGGLFVAEKAAWALKGWLPTENADYCILVTEWAWLRS